MMRLLLSVALASFANFASAAPAEDAATAAAALRNAIASLKSAEGTDDRLAALTKTIAAIETGSSTLRRGMRDVAVQEATIDGRLQSRQSEIATLFETLLLIEKSPEPTLLLHPQGPVGTARSAMLMSGLTPGLTELVSDLKHDLDDLQLLQEIQRDAETVLQDALEAVQVARVNLAQAVSDRTDVPRRFIKDAEKMQKLITSAETLDDFANGLGDISLDAAAAAEVDPANIFGELPLPVVGRVLRKFNEVDAAAIRRPGVIMVTEPGALVTSPAAATVMYQGPLLDYGQVTILEPARDLLLVFAGLGQIFVQTGEVVTKGAPIGLMSDAIGASSLSQDTLYIEVRQDQIPVDPMEWFRVE